MDLEYLSPSLEENLMKQRESLTFCDVELNKNLEI